MKAAAFAYHRPDTVAEAVQMLGEFGDDAKILAGGQSLVPMLAMRLTYFENLIDISRVDELKNIELRDDQVWIGAGTPHALVGMDDEVAESVPLLTLSTPYIGHFQIRTRGTLGGAIAHADPAAEYAAVALALDATMEATSSRGRQADPGGGVLHRPVGDVVGARRDPDRGAVPGLGRPLRFRRRGIRPPPRRFRHRGRDGRRGTRRRRPGGAVRYRTARSRFDAAARLAGRGRRRRSARPIPSPPRRSAGSR